MEGDVLVSVLSCLEPKQLRTVRPVSRAWAEAAAVALPASFQRHW